MEQLSGLFFWVFLASFISIWIVKALTVKFEWVSMPQIDRWNIRTVSLHGGVGFFPVIAISLGYLIFQNYSELTTSIGVIDGDQKQFEIILSILLGSLVMFILGFVDDIISCRPTVKIAFQLIASIIFIYNGGGFLIFETEALNIFITLLWFFVVINAVNLMDNMDGLTTGVVIISLIFLIFNSILGVDGTFPLSVYSSVIMLSSLLAFLFFNWSPATIFMGDSGSLSIGFILAALLIPSPINNYLGITQNDHLSTPVMSLLIPILIIVTLLFDVVFVTITRFLEGRSVMKGGKDHTSHRLVRGGLTEKKSILLIFSLSIIGGVGSVVLLTVNNGYGIFFTLFSIVILLIFKGIYLSRISSS
jgi:UDP-GlcNAc:undecaprenyl-phosphate/decaprenyl-phosphate GlcNAc-1-phosphate transferase